MGMYVDYSRQQQVLHSPFDIETHRQTFTNYLEAVVDETGIVHYAVPSHQQFMINYLIQVKYGTRDALDAAVPREYYADYNTWLCNESGMILVWNNCFSGTPNDLQRDALKKLYDAGLYTGPTE